MMVFDPEYQDLDCPQCHLRRIYLDRDIGYYCMSCGREFNVEEIVLLFEKAERTAQQIPTSGKSEKMPPAEIKELPPLKPKKSKRVRRNGTRHNKSERGASL